ncbi:MAG: hypothetical protein E7473_10230 [Ruminococcaceae bacterium]|nr:hypothetical protein [Oscillospiraceae bacterium]
MKDERKNIDETAFDMSVGEVLDELDDISVDAGEFEIDEILAEFSGGKKSEKIVSFSDDIVPKKVIKTDTKEVPITEIEDSEVEDNVYFDEDVKNEEEEEIKPPKKRSRTSKFAETFDTLTRSELFEDKNVNENIETRSVQEIIKENSKLKKIQGFRSMSLFILSLLSCYLAFSEPLGMYLPGFISYVSNPFRYLFLTVFLQICAMLLSVDVLSRGLKKLLTAKADMESAITFSCFATLTHTVTIMVAPHWRGWLPYSCISVVLLFVTIFSRWLGTRALFRICKIVQATQQPSVVYVENIHGETGIMRRKAENSKSFIAHINDRDASSTFWKILAPIVIVASIVFAAISSFGTDTPEHFFWALAGISCVATPFFAMLSFLFPFSITVKGLSGTGTAISGWYSVTNLSKKANVIVRDEDIFPKGTIVIHGLKVLGNFSLEKTISYAASVIGETKSGLSSVFSDLLRSRYGETEKVTNLKYHETGGFEAEIGRDIVFIGTSGFMLRSGVRLTSGTSVKNAVFIAINRQVAGVFNINYKANADVERALQALVKKKVPVVLAVRDFNLLPTMVERVFDLKDGVLEYPEVEQRIDLSEEEQFISGDATAIVARNGIYPVSSAVIAAKKLRMATIRNVILTTASSLIGMLLMFYLTFVQKPILITPHTVFAYISLWCLPVYLLSLRVK